MSASLLLAELYKGDDPLMVRLRTQLGEIARTPGLVTVLIEGPPKGRPRRSARRVRFEPHGSDPLRPTRAIRLPQLSPVVPAGQESIRQSINSPPPSPSVG
jgi:hypothetical protein